MNARDIVTARIADQARRYPDLNIDALDTHALDARDAALAVAIDHAVIRRWLTLVAVLESQLSRPWHEIEPRMQAILLVGSAQLLLLERLPDHAVINESVGWAKRNIRAKAGGMVNAVLRKVANLRERIIEPASSGAAIAARLHERDELPLNDGRWWKLRDAIFEASPILRISQQTSHPDTLLSRWMSSIGNDAMKAVAHHDLMQPPTILHGTSGNPAGSVLSPHDQPGFYVWMGERNALHEFLQVHSHVIVQDPAAAAIAIATADLNPEPRIIIDACAGMGTKTRQLVAFHPQAQIIASDIDERRFDILQRQFTSCDRVTVTPHRDLVKHAGTADLLLLDVPCSNTGVLARRVEAKYRFSRATLQKIVDLQRQIIADSLILLSPRGVLAYSTCAIEPEENEQQAQWICKWHPFQITRQLARLPQGLPGVPARHYSDGGYWALLQRRPKEE